MSEPYRPRCGCGATWGGLNTAHCAAECHLTFSTVANFDRHRKNGRCVDPATVGLVRLDRDYECWGQPDTRQERGFLVA